MNKTGKVVLIFTVVFMAGVVAGGFTYARFARTVVESRIRSEQFASSQMKRLEESLELTPEQMVRIKPVVEATGDELGRMRRETIAAFQRMEATITKELTSEQREKYEEMQRRMRERRDRDRDRGGSGGPPPSHSSPGSQPSPDKK